MKKIATYITLALILSSSSIFAQKFNKSGDLKQLKGVKKYNLVYRYDNMSVGKYDKEEDYIDFTVDKKNSKSPGDGERWKGEWLGNRKDRFEPKFEELFGIYFQNGIASQNNEEAEITISVHTVFTEPGFNIGIMRQPAYINYVIIFFEAVSGKELASLEVKKVPGRDAAGFDFDTGLRLQESYAKLGKSLGKYLTKALK